MKSALSFLLFAFAKEEKKVMSTCLRFHKNTPILFSLLKIAIINKLTALVHAGGKAGGNPSLLFLRFRR